MAVCVSVIGKDNGPLFFKCRKRGDGGGGLQSSSTSSMSDLEYSFIVSSALDIVEERVQVGHHKGNPALGGGGTGLTPSTGGGDVPPVPSRDLYLGTLTAQEDYRVYGYMTNTKIKFVIIVEEGSVPLRENDIRMMFRKVHTAFCDLMSNPFYQPGTEIHSKRFEGVVNSILVGQ